MIKIVLFLLTFSLTFDSFSQAKIINTSLVYKMKAPSKISLVTPVLIMLHGYGSNEEDLFDIANSLDERLMVYSLRAPIELEKDSYCWYKLERIPGQQFKYDYKSVKTSRELIRSFISNACREFKLDSNAIYLMGFSQGAMLSYDIALSSPGKIKGVVACSGRLMEQSKTLTNNWMKLLTTGFFIGHGRFDNLIPISEGESATAFLKSKGLKSVDFHAYDMQHVLNGQELTDIKKWLSKNIESGKINQDKKPHPNQEKK